MRRLRAALALGVTVAGAACTPDGRPVPEWGSLLEGTACADAAAEIVSAWHGQGRWRDAGPLPAGGRSFRLPTTAIGAWIDAELQPGGRLRLSRVTADAADGVSFSDGCVAERARRDVEQARPGRPSPTFSDTDLRAAVRAGMAEGRLGTVVYVWSPHMALSVDGWAEIERAAAVADLRLEPVLVPGGEGDFAQAEAERVGMPPEALRVSASVEVLYRDGLVHAPSILLFADRRVAPVLPGYRSAEGYALFFEDFFSSR